MCCPNRCLNYPIVRWNSATNCSIANKKPLKWAKVPYPVVALWRQTRLTSYANFYFNVHWYLIKLYHKDNFLGWHTFIMILVIQVAMHILRMLYMQNDVTIFLKYVRQNMYCSFIAFQFLAEGCFMVFYMVQIAPVVLNSPSLRICDVKLPVWHLDGNE